MDPEPEVCNSICKGKFNFIACRLNSDTTVAGPATKLRPFADHKTGRCSLPVMKWHFEETKHQLNDPGPTFGQLVACRSVPLMRHPAEHFRNPRWHFREPHTEDTGLRMLTGSSNSAINQVSLCCIFVPREFYGMEGKSDCSPKFWISDNPEVLAAQPFAYRQGISNAQDSKEIACVHGPSPWRHHSHLSRDSHHNAASDLTPKLLKARSGPWRSISSRD